VSQWKKYELKYLCEEIIDCVNKTAPISPTPTKYKMLRTSDIRNGRINLDDLNCVSSETFEKWTRRGKLKKGDIIFTREAPLGEVGLVKQPENYFLGQRLVLFRANQSVCDNRFLLYALMYHDNKQAIIAKGVGSTVLHLRVPECEKITLNIPEIETQRRIADILSAYDDLIENNRKQIKLLEEAAQRLYKEWFVDLRFPGHEHTRIVDGVPEGWKNGCLSQIAEFKRGKTITKAQIKPGTIPVVAGGLEPAYYHNVANTKAPVITISASGANAGFTRMYHTDVFASDCSFIDKNTCACLPFVYCFLINHKSELDSLQKGSAQPHVYAKDINALQLCLPNSNLLNKFCDFSKRLFLKIGLLEHQSTDLTQARDHLLPKLMSGEMEM
jgi:type I restriction enzyme S subunit